jgi:hypothetical protein
MFLGRNASLLLFVLAGVYIYFTALPRGLRFGPAILALGGLAVYLVQHGLWTALEPWVTIGILLVALGGWLSMTANRRQSDLDPICRELAVLFPRTVRFATNRWMPDHLSIFVVGTLARIDLQETGIPRHEHLIVELHVNCLAGMVDVLLPEEWAVVGGRLASTYGVKFAGRLDSADIFTAPEDRTQRMRLLTVLTKWSEKLPESNRDKSGILVVHVRGFGGEVRVTRGA